MLMWSGFQQIKGFNDSKYVATIRRKQNFLNLPILNQVQANAHDLVSKTEFKINVFMAISLKKSAQGLFSIN